MSGSKTAKDGFKNEHEIAAKFINWKQDTDAQLWLQTLGIDLATLTVVQFSKIPGSVKPDVVVTATNNVGTETVYKISVKLVSTQKGYNQLDKL